MWCALRWIQTPTESEDLMLVRPVARVLLATPFVLEGIDAIRSPQRHTVEARSTLDTACGLARRPSLSDREAARLIRAHGALTVLAATSLAAGRAPRASALVLTFLAIPLCIVRQPFSRRHRQDAAAPEEDADRRVSRLLGDRGVRSFAQSVGLLGAALLEVVDTQGKPGIAWRIQAARAERQARTEH